MLAIFYRESVIEILARLLLAGVLLGINQIFPVFNRIIQNDDWSDLLHPHLPDTIPEIPLLIVVVCLPIASLLTNFRRNSKRMQRNELNPKPLAQRASKKVKAKTSSTSTHHDENNNTQNLMPQDPENPTRVDSKTQNQELKKSSFFVDFVDALLAYSLAILVCLIVVELVKKTAGRPRPDFFNRCFPKIDLNDEDKIQQVIENLEQDFECDIYTADGKDYAPLSNQKEEDYKNGQPRICDEACVQKGRRSFPSGHSAFSWVAFYFLSLYLWGKLRAFTPRYKYMAWRFIPGFLITLIPLYIAVSRTQDYRHHWEDVLVGSLIGILSAWFGYRQYYPSLYDMDSDFSNRQLKWVIENEDNTCGDRWKTRKLRIIKNHGHLAKKYYEGGIYKKYEHLNLV